jgi:DNA polymerase-3 subunit delta'
MTQMNTLYPWQTSDWASFYSVFEQQRLHHAILLTGVLGIGKYTFAQHMVATILCLAPTSQGACGQCHSCHVYHSGNHPDHVEITLEESSSTIKIEQIRALKDKQELTPTISKWKTVVIMPAEKMTISAFNSLLKLLEEPQESTSLILISSTPASLPITIRSRCQQMALTHPDKVVVQQWINEQTQIESSEFEKLHYLSNGAPLTLLSMFENNVSELVERISSDLECLLVGKGNPIQMAKVWTGYDLTLVYRQLQYQIRIKIDKAIEEQNHLVGQRLWYIYDCIVRSIKLTSSPNNINKTLLLEQLIIAVMDSTMHSSLVELN